MANGTNNLSARRANLKRALENHLTAYMGNKTQRNFKNVQAKIQAFINTYTTPVNGGNVPKPPNNNGGNVPKPPNNVLALPAPNNSGGNVPLALPAPNNSGTLSDNKITRLRQIKNNAKNYNNAQFTNANSFVADVSKNHSNHPNVVAARNALAARAASKITQAAIGAVIKTPINVGANANKKNKYTKIRERLNTLTNASNRRTFQIINALEREVQKNENSNAKKAMLNTIENKRLKLRENNNAAKNAAAKAEAAAKNARNAEAAAKRSAQLLEEAKRRETMNAAFRNYMNKINRSTNMNGLGAVNRNIAAANLNGEKKANLRKKIAIQQKKIEGQGKRAERALARATTANNVNLSRGSMNRYGRFRTEINSAPSNKELNRLITVLNGKTGKLFSENERRNARNAINRKRRNLKEQEPVASGNAGSSNLNRASIAELENYLRKIEGRKKAGKPLNKNANFEKRVRVRLNAIRPKGRGLFGHIGGALGAVGGAAIGGVKAVGGAAHYVAAGTVHHATQAARAAAPYVKVGVRYNGKARNKIPKTNLNNNKNAAARALREHRNMYGN